MPSVEFARSITVSAAPLAVWNMVTDVDRVAGWVTVIGTVDERERLSRYSAVLADQLGPFRLSADLDVVVTELEEPTLIAFSADGEDRQVSSRIRIDARLHVTPGDHDTVVDVSGRYEVTGKVASLGSSMIRSKGEKILDQFFESLAKESS